MLEISISRGCSFFIILYHKFMLCWRNMGGLEGRHYPRFANTYKLVKSELYLPAVGRRFTTMVIPYIVYI